MRSAGFVLILGVKPCPRATPLGPGVHFTSQHLTSLAPHPLHKPANGRRCPWSQKFDHIFREEVLRPLAPFAHEPASSCRCRSLARRPRPGVMRGGGPRSHAITYRSIRRLAAALTSLLDYFDPPAATSVEQPAHPGSDLRTRTRDPNVSAGPDRRGVGSTLMRRLAIFAVTIATIISIAAPSLASLGSSCPRAVADLATRSR